MDDRDNLDKLSEGRLELLLDAQRFASARLDKALVELLEEQGYKVSRSQLAQSFAAALVRSGTKVLKASHRIEADLKVSLCLPKPAPLAHAFAEKLPLELLYEDESLLVINKAAGMVVHAGPGHSSGTLVNAVLYHLGCKAGDLPVLAGNGAERPGVVHRLDRDTSGVMVMAKNVVAQDALAQQFRRHSIGRRYVAIVRGVPKWNEKRLETLHGRDTQDRRRFTPEVSQGRKAVTTFSCQKRYEHASVLHCHLETGRTHQIRMHARHLGHAILADALYATKARVPRLREIEAKLGRQALHAEYLAFEHPARGDQVEFWAPYPEDLRRCLGELEGGWRNTKSDI